MRCLSCQYDLSKLTEHRCPECGRAFDPSLPETFESEALPIERERGPWIGVLLVLSACVLAVLGWYVYLMRSFTPL